MKLMYDSFDALFSLKLREKASHNGLFFLREEFDGHLEGPAFTGGLQEVCDITGLVWVDRISKRGGEDLDYVDQDVALEGTLEDLLDYLC